MHGTFIDEQAASLVLYDTGNISTCPCGALPDVFISVHDRLIRGPGRRFKIPRLLARARAGDGP